MLPGPSLPPSCMTRSPGPPKCSAQGRPTPAPTHVSWVPKKKTWYLLAVDFTAASGISSICEQDDKGEPE